MAGGIQASTVMWKACGRDAGRYYRLYLVFLLASILMLNNLDRTALGLVLPGIKSALNLTDTELGVLTGVAFSIFYSTVGILLGLWADRGDRVRIIALTTALWGIMVMLMGTARSFGELLIVRIGVAVGEAGCLPAAYSLIGDYFAREERPRAVANYLLGASLSLILGYFGAGWLTYHYGWRLMFVCIGMPSVVAAPIAWWTLAEPRRSKRQSVPDRASRTASPDLRQVMKVLWETRTFKYILAMLAVNYFFGTGILVWQPSFFTRSYGIGVERLGVYLSLIYGFGGVIGTYCGGYLASRYAPRNERLQLSVLAVSNAVFAVVSLCTYLSMNASVSLSLLGLFALGGAAANGPLFAAVQAVVPEQMRAISMSVIFLFCNLLGAGLGPLAVGALSDALHPYLGSESLRYALLVMSPGYFVGCWLLWRAARTVCADAELLRQAEERPAAMSDHGGT